MTEAAGTDEAAYHMMSLAGGIPAGVLFLFGFLLLLRRRFARSGYMKVNTSTMDKWLYLILFLLPKEWGIVQIMKLKQSSILVLTFWLNHQ